MDMLEVHTQALASVNEALHIFLLRYRKDKMAVYGLVEGKEDPMFYRSIIERFIPEDWSVVLIAAGNKEKLFDTYRALDWTSFSSRQVAFFTDRDLSLITDPTASYPENVYVTDGYSIENSIVCADVFYRLLEEAYNVVDATDLEKEFIKESFSKDLYLFQQFMIPVMAQIIGWRKNKNKANLNNLDLSPLLEFYEGKLQIALEYECEDKLVDHLCACVGAERLSSEEADRLKAEFLSISGPGKFVRGKYLMWLLAKSVGSMHASITRFVAAYHRPPKIKNPIGPGNVMVSAAPRARIPASLKDFLERTFLKHIAECAACGECS